LTAQLVIRMINCDRAFARSTGWIVKEELSAWVETEEERHRLTLEALADVDAGQVIDHQAVQAWAQSLGTKKPRPAPLP
jgi:predicted transcriptional regulator